MDHRRGPIRQLIINHDTGAPTAVAYDNRWHPDTPNYTNYNITHVLQIPMHTKCAILQARGRWQRLTSVGKCTRRLNGFH